MDLIKSLILNLSLLITLSFISSFVYEYFYSKKKLNILFQTIIFCALSIYSILNPVVVAENFNFDGRTILISISTFFFGPIVGILTTIASLITRINFGIVNLLSATISVLAPFLIGLFFHNLNKRKLFEINSFNLFLFGAFNSLAIFFLMFIVIRINRNEYIEIQRAALSVFPFMTMLVGLVINSGKVKTNLLLKIQESESRWRATFHSINDGIILFDLNGKIINVNNALKKLFKIQDFNSFKSLGDLLKMKDFEKNEDLVIHSYFEQLQLNDKRVIIYDQNKQFLARISLNKISDKNEFIVGYVLVIRDITKEIEDQERIINSEKTFKGVFDSIQEAIYIQDSNGNFIDVNSGAVQMNGYEKKEFIGKSLSFLSVDSKNDHLDLKNLLIRAYNGESQIFGFWGRKKDNTIFPKIVSLYPGEYFGEKVIISVAVDISNLRLAQDKLIEKEKLLTVLINATPDIIYVKDGSNNWIEINKGMLSLLGVADDIINEDFNQHLLDNLEPISTQIIEIFEKLEASTWMNKTVTRTEHQIKLSNGFKRYFDIILIPLFNDDGSRKKIIVVGRDITLRKRDEEEKHIMLNKLSNVIENFDGGILLEDSYGKIEFVNDYFIKLFRIKQNKLNLRLSESNVLFDLISSNFTKSEYFLVEVNDCKKVKSSRLGIEFNTNDEKIFEANYLPIIYENVVVNHLWIFRNVTQTKMFEKKLKSQLTELEKFNNSMVERELRMIELKKEVNDLLVKSGFSPKYTIIE